MLYSELQHFGINGMHWGVRRAQMQVNETAYRKKLTAITNNPDANKHDVKFFKSRNKTVVGRVGVTVGKAVMTMVIGDILTGKIRAYSGMKPAEILMKTTKIAKKVATNLVFDTVAARSASNKYNSSGKQIKGQAKGPTKEQVIISGVKTALTFGPIAAKLMGARLGNVQRERTKNEKTFKDWGQNILPAKVSTIVWSNDNQSVIQPSTSQKTAFDAMRSVGKG